MRILSKAEKPGDRVPRKDYECVRAEAVWPSLASWDHLGNQPQSPVSKRVEDSSVKEFLLNCSQRLRTQAALSWDSEGRSDS